MAFTAEAWGVHRTRHLEPCRGRQQRQPGDPSASEMPGLKQRSVIFMLRRKHRLESLKEGRDSFDPNPPHQCWARFMSPQQTPVTCPARILPSMIVSSLTPFFHQYLPLCGPLNKPFLPPSSTASVSTLDVVLRVSPLDPHTKSCSFYSQNIDLRLCR